VEDIIAPALRRLFELFAGKIQVVEYSDIGKTNAKQWQYSDIGKTNAKQWQAAHANNTVIELEDLFSCSDLSHHCQHPSAG
jgi:hypothetical protein